MKPSCTIPLSVLLLLSLGAGAQGLRKPPTGDPGVFDYYALSMSWSPGFCATHTDPHQCATGRQFGFVLHGLWPQYQQGYPQSCSRQRITPALEQKYGPLYASPKLIFHEWPRHGTCSGLTPEQYFDLTAKLKQGLVIPAQYQRPSAPVRVSSAQFAQAFMASNPSLAEAGVLPFCNGGGRFLREILVCYSKSGQPQSCGITEIQRSRTSCGKSTFLMESVH
jgi:ribonuclease T2